MTTYLQVHVPEVAALADKVDLSKPTALNSDSSSSGSSSSSSSDSSASSASSDSDSDSEVEKKKRYTCTYTLIYNRYHFKFGHFKIVSFKGSFMKHYWGVEAF